MNRITLISIKKQLNTSIQGYSKVIDDYLQEVEKRSHGAYLNQKIHIIDCLNFINKPLKDITILNVRDYLIFLDNKKSIKYTSKTTYRSHLTSFFKYYRRVNIETNPNYLNPVPDKDIFDFTKTENDFKKISDKNSDKFSREELITILRLSKKREFRDFIIFAILIFTGMRISEALTIKIKYTNLEKRFIETGDVKDARKSNKTLLFFIPKFSTPFLEQYIMNMKKKSIWLFPGRSSFLNKNSWYDLLKNHYPKIYSKSQKFRKTIVSEYVKNGCEIALAEILTNHTPTSLTAEYYLKLEPEEKRDLYDKFFPYYDFAL